ncbi:probable protein phosphatase 2C 4 [Nicotiana sylvestris]|uniref:protein-serine/threonine phosphatase n=1 Tax=Nicotiana sylvestris TaxID=4096 RepID=A0A1U7WDK1_NICSY|nr:PREDICTED: probable protein phosphatase 2C 23 [Nicotiana sylvestris]
MGNGMGKLKLCFAGDVGEISKRHHDIAVNLSDHLDDVGLGHSFCYIRPDPSFSDESSSSSSSTNSSQTTVFRTISGASISANASTPLSTALFDFYTYTDISSSAFESSPLFSSIPLQPIPRRSVASIRSGPISRVSCSGSGPTERGFVSGPIERGYLVRSLRKVLSSSFLGIEEMSFIEKKNKINLADDVEGNVQWAQGKAGEDRVHIVVSEEHGWVFVGIYDGFNGPDATDFLLNNLYSNVIKELKRFPWNDKLEISEDSTGNDIVRLVHQSQEFDEKLNNLGTNGDAGIDQFDILKALSEALRKTEASYLEMADMMLKENPELALMGSCVLVMLLNGKDVYFMNVGDSRALLAQNPESDPFDSKLGRINEESLNLNSIDALCRVESNLTSCQLTMDHTTSDKEEVLRIRSEHPDDVSVIKNDRVKGSLKVTRAFGAGYLKEAKWNNALLEMFRIDYIGNSPYINCLPSLYHHKLGPRDRFLILSSDGLYQYFTNEEAVSEVENFMSIFPEGDPSQHLVEEVLFRAAKKAGMNFHELLDIPPGDRRQYHDDVSIIIISFEGKLWRSSA